MLSKRVIPCYNIRFKKFDSEIRKTNVMGENVGLIANIICVYSLYKLNLLDSYTYSQSLIDNEYGCRCARTRKLLQAVVLSCKGGTL